MNNLIDTSDDEYVNVNELDIEHIDAKLDTEDNTMPVYQLQPIDNTNKCVFMEVGKFSKSPSVFINKFTFINDYQCTILACLYTNEELKLLGDIGRFPIFRILITTEKKGVVGNMILYFSTDIHQKEDGYNNIMDYTTGRNDIKNEIVGSYTLTFHHDIESTELVIDHKDAYVSTQHMIEWMIESLHCNELLEHLHL